MSFLLHPDGLMITALHQDAKDIASYRSSVHYVQMGSMCRYVSSLQETELKFASKRCQLQHTSRYARRRQVSMHY